MTASSYSSAHINRTLKCFDDEKYDYQSECKKVMDLAKECGLQEHNDDIRLCRAFLKGILVGRQK